MEKIAIVGIGYVGLPLAVVFSKKYEVIGFDSNREKIEKYQLGYDVTGEISSEDWKDCNIKFTSEEKDLSEASVYIICVPTPINEDKNPDLTAIRGATKTVGRFLEYNNLVIYESTVYPGATEEICVPILEYESNLKCGKDFKIGYSPERINPGDKIHTIYQAVKIVSACDEDTLAYVTRLYESVLMTSVYPVSNIRIAEAVKLIENTQRDINIAFMNEVSFFCKKMGIDMREMINAMNTKWNALHFSPGLVGGHCIGVDSYYYLYQARRIGCDSSMVSAGRKINEYMSGYVADQIIEKLLQEGKKLTEARVLFLGIAFKENCRDIRNTKVVQIVESLKNAGCHVQVADYMVDSEEVSARYGIEIVPLDSVKNVDCVILSVPHEKYRDMNVRQYDCLFVNHERKIFFDIMHAKDETEMTGNGYVYWTL